MIERRECLRTKVALPLRYGPLTAEETELVAQGRGGTLLARTAHLLPSEWQTSTSGLHSSGQESVVFQYLQLLDAKLNWIIDHITANEEELSLQGETIDIGGGGLCFAASDPLPVDTMLRMKLQLPFMAPLAVNFIAQVLRAVPRTHSQAGHSDFAIAVKFIEIGEEQRERIIQFIFGKERQELRRRKEGQVSGG